MKPSIRIEEIRKKLAKARGFGEDLPTAMWIQAIQDYLDEIYEAENSAREQLKKDIKPMD